VLELWFTHGVLLAVSELVKNLCARSQEHKLCHISFMDLILVQYCCKSLAVRARGSFQVDSTSPLIRKTAIVAIYMHRKFWIYSIVYMSWCHLFRFFKENQNGKGCY
jgi:hypothetical protein